MNRFLIGHRGTGKTQFLKAYQIAHPEVFCVDLDQEITKKEGLNPKEIFERQGEAAFREIEKNVLDEVLQENASKDKVICLGAGFDLDYLGNENICWISRRSDFKGRIFLNRPSLGRKISHPREALNDYFERFETRQRSYKEKSKKNVLALIEGGVSSFDFDIFNGKYSLNGASLSITPEVLSFSEDEIKNYFKKLEQSDIRFIEFRTDLFSGEDIHHLWAHVSQPKRLLSIRNSRPVDFLIESAGALDVDERFFKEEYSSLNGALKILSSHSQKAPEIRKNWHLKWAPLVENGKALREGHLWQREDSSHRSFLPRSPNLQQEAQFTWYRLTQKSKQLINFVKEREYDLNERKLLSNHDQPLISEWLRWNSNFTHFSALLGNPALHSWTPAFHEDFFRKKSFNIASIPINEDDFDESLNFLISLGLKSASVTSPFKKNLFEKADQRDASCFVPESANTLVVTDSGQLKVWNTDWAGFQFLYRGLEHLSCATIGGGGVLNILQHEIHKGSFYSARSLELKKGRELGHYDIVIWAGGGDPTQLEERFLPESCQNPKIIIDLDYRDSSTARALAFYLNQDRKVKQRIKYIPGHKMFFKQAKLQAQIWSQEF